MTQPDSPPPRALMPVVFPGRDTSDFVPVAEAKGPDQNRPTVTRQQSDTGLKDFRAIPRHEKRIEVVQLPEGEADPKASSATGNASPSPSASPDSLVDLEALRAYAEKEQQTMLPWDEVEPGPHQEIGETTPPAKESLPGDEANRISSFLPM